jgi:hypothetical protein
MTYKMLFAAAALMVASPAFAGGHGGGGSLLGGVIAPVNAVVSALNVSALNHSLNGNQIGILNGTTVAIPVNVSKNNILSGLLGGGSHGCGCN